MALDRLAARPSIPAAEWRVTLGTAAVLFLDFGVVYSMSTFHVAQHAALGGSTADLGFVFSLAGAFYYAIGTLSGRLADRHGAAVVVFCGMLAVATGLAVASLARSILAFDLAYGVGIGLGVGFAFAPALGAVQRRCASWRAAATGYASLGLGLGALIAPPAAAALAARLGPAGGMRVLALVVALGIASALLLRRASDCRQSRTTTGRAGTVPSRLKRSPAFVRLYASSLCFALAAFVPFAHLPSIAEHRGWSPQAGALLVGAIGLGSTIARLGLCHVVRGLGARRTLATAGIALSLGILVATLSASFAALAVAAFIIGLGYGGGTAVLPPLAAETFGTARISEIVGDIFTARSLGILVGPALTGIAFAHFKDFRLPFIATALLAMVSALWLMERLPSPDATQAQAIDRSR